MAMVQNDVQTLGATRINIGLSAIIKVAPFPFQANMQFQKLAGGSLEIVPLPIALSGTSCAGWGTGYMTGASEIISMTGPAIFYLAATNATVTIAAFSGQCGVAGGMTLL